MEISPFEKVIEINTGRPLGVATKYLIRDIAQNLPIYNTTYNSGLEGQDSKGNIIKVDTVGRFLFGVPGYPGKLRYYPEENKVYIFYPKDSAPVVEDLLKALKETFENNL